MAIDVAMKYGLDMTGATDNAAKLAQLASDVASWKGAGMPGGPLPRLVFREGTCSFSAWPDLAYGGLQMVAEGECRLQYTGAGDGVIFDASKRNPSAEQPGIDNLTFEGFDIIARPTGVPLGFYGIHRSNLAARVLAWNGSTNLRPAILMQFCIITTLRPVVSSGRAGPSITGIFVDAWPGKPNLQTTACTIEQPCLEGCSTGIYWKNAGSCQAIGGTIENCGVGVQLGSNAGNNMHICVEMEGNGVDALETSGSKANGFLYCGNGSKINTSFGPFSSNWSRN